MKLAERLGIGERIVWRHMLNKPELASWIAGAELSLAPLTECSRNIEQGCAPLKILESMALGVPVLASDLPAVREIITDGVDGFLVRPDRPAELARAVELLLEQPARARHAGAEGRRRIESAFTWEASCAMLRGVYRGLMSPCDAPDSST
jgi:glycosyltransferase involved in cell wall biosynthesis